MLQEVQEVQQIAALQFGAGLVGADRHLEGAEKQNYLRGLTKHQHEIPSGLWLPGDCMDDRDIIALADGTTDPLILKARRATQYAGGVTLATMKAGIAANAAFLRDAKTSKQAYEITHDLLEGFGIQEAAHEGCGASKFVQESVANRLPIEKLVQTFGALGVQSEAIRQPLFDLDRNKFRQLEAGFYEDWDPKWHADFVSSKHPENFSYLKTAEDDVYGHYASGLLLIKDGHYFSKNAFSEETKKYAFALTLGEADKIANLIGAPEERALLRLAFRDDSFNVANHIVAEGLEVIA